MRNPVYAARDIYARFERPISSISLIGGFVFDAITLKRVDMFWENFWVLIHLLIVAVCIVLINLEEQEGIDPSDATKAHFWFVNILQFVFGGLLSTFLVFYFRSATLLVSWPFLLLLALAFAANERLKRHYARLSFQISLFFLSLFSFAIFAVPVLAHRIGPWIFVISGVSALAVLLLFLLLLRRLTKERFIKSRGILQFSIAAIFVGMNLLYFTNIIPPIPLSLKDAGVYHSVVKNITGNYIVAGESGSWLDIFSLYPDFHLEPGGAVYAYSAVFSPANLNTRIVYDWQQYDSEANRWNSITKVPVDLIGGRAEGYRSYSVLYGLPEGRWRVNIETTQGQVIGRILFTVVPVTAEPQIESEVKA